MKIYCQKCGAKIEFSVKSKPKFCHGCGSSLSLGVNRSASSIDQDSQDEEETDVKVVPSISSLDVDIEVTNQYKTEKLGTVVGTSPKEAKGDYRSGETPLSKDEFREMFQKEAGSLKRNSNPQPPDEEK